MRMKYFYLIFFCIIMLIFGVLLHLTITHDIQNNTPPDPEMKRVEAVVKELNSYSSADENGVVTEHYNVLVSIKVNEREHYDNYPLFDVPKTDINHKLTVKYDENNPGVFYYDDIPQPHYRTVLYVLFSVGIVASLASAIFASRFLQHREFVRNRDEWLKAHPNENLPGNEIPDPAAESYEGYDGKDPNVDLNPFGGSDMDYNALYEYDQKMNDASYSAEGTYSGYDNAPSSGSYSNNPMDAPYDPNASYSGYDNASSSGSYSNNPMDAPYDPNASYSGYDNAPSSGSYSNNPMDTPYDPFAPYSGYEEPDSSSDTPYYPNAGTGRTRSN